MSTFTGGIVSGIDTASLIASLVAANSTTVDLVKAQKSVVSARKDAYGTLASRLATLSSAVEAIDTSSEFRSVTGSSNSDAVGISVTGDAVVGHLSVQVDQLASSAMEVSDAVASRTSSGTMAQGTWGFTVAGVTTSVTIGADESSLDDLVSAINAQVSGVTAYVMDTGDATTPYRLVVAADSTGAANTVSIDTSGLDGGTGTVPAFTEVTHALDAELQVNGVSVTSANNEVTGVIQGVTINALDVTASAATLTVARNTTSMVTKVSALVTAYNSVMSYVRGQKAWNPDEGIQGSFIGESKPTDMVRALQSAISSQYSTGGEYDTLSSLGITTTQTGDLEFDSATLTTALNDGMNDVTSFVTDSTAGFAAAMTSLIEGLTGDDGSITTRSESLDEELSSYDQRIATYEDQLAAYQARLEKQFTAMELAIAGFNAGMSAISALLPSTTSSSSSSSSS